MKIISTILIIAAILLFGVSAAFSHTPAGDQAGGPSASQMMTRMMEMMHGNIEGAKTVNCNTVSDEVLMKRGEEMMEQIMGHEDHERVEEVMEKDMQDHDAMHLMMGMWATGCVGDEAMAALMDRHGISQRLQALEEKSKTQIGWSAVAAAVLIGAIIGWFGAGLSRKKPQA